MVQSLHESQQPPNVVEGAEKATKDDKGDRREYVVDRIVSHVDTPQGEICSTMM